MPSANTLQPTAIPVQVSRSSEVADNHHRQQKQGMKGGQELMPPPQKPAHPAKRPTQTPSSHQDSERPRRTAQQDQAGPRQQNGVQHQPGPQHPQMQPSRSSEQAPPQRKVRTPGRMNTDGMYEPNPTIWNATDRPTQTNTSDQPGNTHSDQEQPTPADRVHPSLRPSRQRQPAVSSDKEITGESAATPSSDWLVLESQRQAQKREMHLQQPFMDPGRPPARSYQRQTLPPQAIKWTPAPFSTEEIIETEDPPATSNADLVDHASRGVEVRQPVSHPNPPHGTYNANPRAQPTQTIEKEQDDDMYQDQNEYELSGNEDAQEAVSYERVADRPVDFHPPHRPLTRNPPAETLHEVVHKATPSLARVLESVHSGNIEPMEPAPTRPATAASHRPIGEYATSERVRIALDDEAQLRSMVSLVI